MTQFILFLNQVTGEGIIQNVSDISYIKRLGNKILLKPVSFDQEVIISEFPADQVQTEEDKKVLNFILDQLNRLSIPITAEQSQVDPNPIQPTEDK
jgi:hypothetical protein